MSAWTLAATVLAFCLVPAGAACLRGDPVERLVGLELATTIVVFLLVAMAEASSPLLLTVPLVLSSLMLGGSLVFVRFLERWL